MAEKKICVITGSRAEYGLLKLIINEIIKSKSLELKLIVTGSHLSSEYGNTFKEIESDGIEILHKIEILEQDDDISFSMSRAFKIFPKKFQELKPDLVLILGDRYEIFSAATVAYINKIPIAHIHGGETTEGAFDEGFRHAITKMAYLHFASTEIYKKRIIQLGENPDRVFNYGSPGIEAIKKIDLYDKNKIFELLGLDLVKKTILITFHPETLNLLIDPKRQINSLLEAIRDIKEINLVFTKANADPGGAIINNEIEKFSELNKSNTYLFESLGQKKYLSLLKYAACVVGNSSSGIIEAPSFNVGTVNIGSRQKGRIKSESIIDVDYNTKQIKSSILKILDQPFLNNKDFIDNPYETRDTSKKIVKAIKDSLARGIKPKIFFDLKI